MWCSWVGLIWINLFGRSIPAWLPSLCPCSLQLCECLSPDARCVQNHWLRWAQVIPSISFLIVVTFSCIDLSRIKRFLVAILIYLSMNSTIAIISQSISSDWLFSWSQVIYFCFSTCLVICDWMLNIISFTVLYSAGFCCVILKSVAFYSGCS